MTFDDAFDKLLGLEGGYSDHAADPGGKTRYGITEAVARAHGYTGDMRQLPVDLAKRIYRQSYWDRVRADELPGAIRYAVFDGAVNSGAGQSVRWLQQALGVPVDGLIGPQTIGAARAADPLRLKMAMLSRRLNFLSGLGTWSSFGRGWARRIAELLT